MVNEFYLITLLINTNSINFKFVWLFYLYKTTFFNALKHYSNSSTQIRILNLFSSIPSPPTHNL